MTRRVLLRILGGWCLVLMLLFYAAYLYAGHGEAAATGTVFGFAGVCLLASAE